MKRNMIAAILGIVLTLGITTQNVSAANVSNEVKVSVTDTIDNDVQEADEKTIGLNVTSRTKKEIMEFIKENPVDMYQPVEFRIEPSLQEPYAEGILSETTQQSALNLINQIRYIAGLDANVILDEEYSRFASGATLLNCLNNTLSHNPERPEVLKDSKYDELYALGYKGASSSNLGMGYRNLNMSILHGWMADANSSNIDRVGHRRWVLNPSMGKIGFGSTGRYYAMWSFDKSGTGEQSYVAWPAQVMPTEYFHRSYPWSVSTGHTINSSDVTVEMVRRSDNKSWSFSTNASDGEFYVNNGGFGQKGCIIWRPNDLGDISVGDVFDISIIEKGYDTVKYSVSFIGSAITGDVDEDGAIKVNDVLTILHSISGSQVLDENQQAAADVDKDGAVTVRDVLRILHYMSGASDTL